MQSNERVIATMKPTQHGLPYMREKNAARMYVSKFGRTGASEGVERLMEHEKLFLLIKLLFPKPVKTTATHQEKPSNSVPGHSSCPSRASLARLMQAPTVGRCNFSAMLAFFLSIITPFLDSEICDGIPVPIFRGLRPFRKSKLSICTVMITFRDRSRGPSFLPAARGSIRQRSNHFILRAGKRKRSRSPCLEQAATKIKSTSDSGALHRWNLLPAVKPPCCNFNCSRVFT